MRELKCPMCNLHIRLGEHHPPFTFDDNGAIDFILNHIQRKHSYREIEDFIGMYLARILVEEDKR
jgi:hypothetical protein